EGSSGASMKRLCKTTGVRFANLSLPKVATSHPELQYSPMVTSRAATAPNAGEEAIAHLRALLRIDTTNPPGNESPAAEYLADTLREAGIEPVMVEKVKGRANVIARLRGNGEAAPLLLGAHLDVVEADPKRWRHSPFGGDVAEGYVWGRG